MEYMHTNTSLGWTLDTTETQKWTGTVTSDSDTAKRIAHVSCVSITCYLESQGDQNISLFVSLKPAEKTPAGD